jgi:dTDP-4-dehydrorhamnose 3,5-epimerase
MQIIKTDFPGLLIIEPAVHRDERGFFIETFREENFVNLGVKFHCVQANQSYSSQKGILRGLHFQAPPKAQAKLIWVTRGEVLDVVLDLRESAPTFGRHCSVHLSAANFRRLFIPKGFAHAYFTLSLETEFNYMVDEYYSPQHEAGVFWNDPALGIKWPLEVLSGESAAGPLISPKDQRLPLFKDLERVNFKC